MPLKPCIQCGQPTTETRCDEHPFKRRNYPRPTATARGYDAAWQRLSRRARTLAPFCEDAHLGGCNGPLTADHRPSTWTRRDHGLPLRLQDVSVVCMRHNALRGKARGNNVTRTD